MEKFNKILNTVNKELVRWTSVNLKSSTMMVNTIRFFEDFIQNPSSVNVITYSNINSFWHQVNFIKSKLLDNSLNEEFFSNYMLCKIASIKFTLAMGQVYPGKNLIPMVSVTDAISLAAISRQWNYYSDLTEVFLTHIDSEYMHKGIKNSKHSWFVIQLYCISTGKKLDTKALNYPKNLDIYDSALAVWNSSDLAVLDKIIYDICEYHINNSSQKSSSEFQDISLFVFPLEILCWLSIRNNHGLNNPTEYSHPMMQLNINRVFEKNIVVTKDELLNNMIQSFNSKYPQARFDI